MSKESVDKFLTAIVSDTNNEIRGKFADVTNPQEFITKCQELGYIFTTDELKAVLEDKSEGVEVRRNTGVWKWLRQYNWLG